MWVVSYGVGVEVWGLVFEVCCLRLPKRQRWEVGGGLLYLGFQEWRFGFPTRQFGFRQWGFGFRQWGFGFRK